MTGKRLDRGGHGAGCAVAWLVLAVFALRATVPLGYMPDLSALGEGHFQIVVCTGAGIQTLEVDENGQPIEADHPGRPAKSAADCPFATAITKALALPDSLPLPADLGQRAEAFFPQPAPALLPPAQGPPLGSRAPPAHLG
ncbi:hypothetical protein SAMN06265365_13237 [Tistlia consotensis]|uniref:DUF2946 domain-containing protein n=1 Tax=Tistlia consotensis USBA 355 TaxID=560819 RepID=A0A1Y6CMI6_9PROT|nr:DUF2946 family protein [Tistlia consotensis]SMF76313.1 hypothetical protein SAMN05428998_13537 [Tistlia consotensis USBA 355]SNS12635.1 hypothetical protein SAMN06265365_13237 [Tistlia consotensis]